MSNSKFDISIFASILYSFICFLYCSTTQLTKDDIVVQIIVASGLISYFVGIMLLFVKKYELKKRKEKRKEENI